MMRRKQNKKRNLILKYFVAIILIIIILEIALFVLEKDRKEVRKEMLGGLDKNKSVVNLSGAEVNMYLPAVDSEGNGVSTLLNVDVVEGKGRTLVDIEGLLFWADTQHSIRIAKLVAENITSKEAENYDFIYSIKANASVIGGPSAGAALAVATIAALENKKLREDVMITGTLNHDGSIGPVSEIYAKAKAAKQQSMTIFLVPLLQSRDVIYETEEHCEKFGFTEICTSETKPKRVDISKDVGIEVKEVENVKEAMDYFFE